MKLKDGFVLRRIGGHHIVVPIGAQTVDFNCMLTLNDTGAFLWQKLQEEITEEALTAALLEEYDVTEDAARADVARFIDSLREAALLA